jgi:hypothetical protein
VISPNHTLLPPKAEAEAEVEVDVEVEVEGAEVEAAD